MTKNNHRPPGHTKSTPRAVRRQGQTIVMNVSIPASLLSALDELAKRERRSRSWTACDLIEKALIRRGLLASANGSGDETLLR